MLLVNFSFVWWVHAPSYAKCDRVLFESASFKGLSPSCVSTPWKRSRSSSEVIKIIIDCYKNTVENYTWDLAAVFMFFLVIRSSVLFFFSLQAIATESEWILWQSNHHHCCRLFCIVGIFGLPLFRGSFVLLCCFVKHFVMQHWKSILWIKLLL